MTDTTLNDKDKLITPLADMIPLNPYKEKQ